MPKNSTHITVTTHDKAGVPTTRDVTFTELYKGRSPEELIQAEKWSDGACNRIFGPAK